MNELEIFSRVLIFGLGAAVGSFLNVCIVRLPQEKSIIWPGSHCVQCQKPIAWYDNIPILSFLLLKGRCRSCQGKISWRYFIVELLTAGLFLFFYVSFGLRTILIPYYFLLSALIVATFVDLELRIIPDEVSIGGMLLGVVLSFMIPSLHEASIWDLNSGRVVMWAVVGICVMLQIGDAFIKSAAKEEWDLSLLWIILGTMVAEMVLWFVVGQSWKGPFAEGLRLHLLSLDASLQGVLIGGGSIYAMGMLGDIIFRKESMGGGDIKLLAMVGAFLGWKLSILSFFIAPLFGAVAGIIVKIKTKENVIAYGPFLALGALISLFWGQAIIDWILSGYGLF